MHQIYTEHINPPQIIVTLINMQRPAIPWAFLKETARNY